MPKKRIVVPGKEPLPRSSYDVGERKWHIFYLRPRAEKMVYRVLKDLDHEVFFPTIQSYRVWKNRQKKRIEFPLFPNYLFVNTYEYELHDIRCLPRVVTYVSSCGRPATISETEMAGVKRMLGLKRGVTVETEFYQGEPVRIIGGPLAGYEGVLVRQNGKNRFGIQLKAIEHTVFVDISTSALEKL